MKITKYISHVTQVVVIPALLLVWLLTLSVSDIAEAAVPKAENISVDVIEESSGTTLNQIFLRAQDSDRDPLIFIIFALPAKGILKDGNNGTIISFVPYTLSAGNMVEYTPNSGISADSDSFSFKVADGTDDSSIANVAINITAWFPPIGIPDPGFGITEEHLTYADIAYAYDYGSGPEPYRIDLDGPYTHYVDNTDINAEDFGNPYGTPAIPRLTLPPNPPAGSVIEIHGGPYPGADYVIMSSGDATTPIFFRGATGIKPIIEQRIRVRGAYIIFENLDFDKNNSAQEAFDIRPETGTDSIHHIAIRNCEFHNYMTNPPMGGSLIKVGNSALGDTNLIQDIIICRSYIHDNNVNYDPLAKQDIHGLEISANVQSLWYLDNYSHSNSGSSVQIMWNGTAPTVPPRLIYIGRNELRNDAKAAIDLKASGDIIISENLIHDYIAGNQGADGTGILIDGDNGVSATNIWIMHNRIYICAKTAVSTGSGCDEIWSIGNIIYNIINTNDNSASAFKSSESEKVYTYFNTIYNTDTGISYESTSSTSQAEIKNNIISTLSYAGGYHLYIVPYADQAEMSHNLLYQEGGAARIRWYSNTYDVSGFQFAQPAKSVGFLENNPLFVYPGENDLRLDAGSPCIDMGLLDPVVAYINKFQTLYSINLGGVDVNGNIRFLDGDGSTTPESDIGAYEYLSPDVPSWNITATAGANGAIDPSGIIPVNEGVSLNFTITPDVRYHVDYLLDNFVPQGALTSYTLNDIKEDHTIGAYFAINTYIIEATAQANGSINPSGTITVNEGDNQQFTVTPNPSYHIDDVLVDSSSVGAVPNYEFTTVSEYHTIEASFAINTHIITATAGLNGSITPNGNVVVDEGNNQSFTVIPDAGYQIKKVLLDGEYAGVSGSYQFTNVYEPHTIHADFMINGLLLRHYTHTIIDDWSGQSYLANGDKKLNPGETIELSMELKNGGPLGATGISAVISINDAYISVIDGQADFPDTPSGAVSSSLTNFVITTLDTAPDRHTASVTLEITSDNGYWREEFPITVMNPYSGAALNEIRLDTDIAGAADSYDPQMTQDNSGNVYAVWSDNRDGHVTIYFNHSPDYGVTWQENDTRIDNNANMSATLYEPQISCDNAGNVYVVWYDNRNGAFDIYFNYSRDYGATWQTADIRIDTDTAGIKPSYGARITCDNSGNVYITWCDERAGNKDVYFNYSNDYGATWNNPDERIDNAASNKNSYNPVICTDGNGNVYITWQDNRDGEEDIYLNSSVNGGVSWRGADKRIDQNRKGQSVSNNPRISCDAEGHVYVVWRDYRNGGADIYFNYSSDNGDNWLGRDLDKRLDTDTKGAAHSYDPKISSDSSGHVYVTWVDFRNGRGDIYFNFSPDNGSTWQSSDIRLDTDAAGNATSATPEISCNNNNNVFVTWYDFRNSSGIRDIYLNYSTDAGTTWLVADIRIDDETLPPANSSNPKVRCDDKGNAFIIWHDSRNGPKNDIYLMPFVAPTDLPELNFIADQTIKEGEPCQFNIVAHDGKKRILTLLYPDSRTLPPALQAKISQATFQASFDPPSGNNIGSFAWTPDSDSAGTYDPIIFVARNEATRRCVFQAMSIYVRNTYTITATSTGNGTISPSGGVIVSEGENQQFMITPDVNNHIVDVIVDGSSIGKVTSHGFMNVTADHTIHVVFAIDTFSLAIIAVNGSVDINPPGTVFDYGTNVTLTATPDSDYFFTGWSGDLPGGVNPQDTTIIVPMNRDRTLTATFVTEIITYTITATSTLGGSISPSGNVEVNEGSDQIFAITPSNGYHIEDVLVNGVSQGAIDSYKFSSISSNNTIHAIFAQDKPELHYLRSIVTDDWTGDSFKVNGDGQFNTGERIELRIDLKNTGRALASGVSARLSTTDPGITIIQDTIYFTSNISVGEHRFSNNSFLIEDSGIARTVGFVLNITGAEGTWIDAFQIAVTDPSPGPATGNKMLNTDPAGNAGSFKPQISSDANGTIYVVWEDTRNGNTDIYFNYSLDYGTTWHTDIRLDTRDSADSRDPKISSDINGNVYVVWREDNSGRPDIHFNCSHDYGATWQTVDTRIDTSDSADSYEPMVTSDLNGNVYVVWRNDMGAHSDIYFNNSSDFGTSWRPAGSIRIDKDLTGTADSVSPMMASSNGGDVYIVWEDNRNGVKDIFLNYSSDSGNTWKNTDIRIDTSAGVNSDDPCVETDNLQNVYVVWREDNNVRSDIHFNYSNDYGATWKKTSVRIDTSPSSDSYSPKITSDATEKLYVVWRNDLNGNATTQFNYSKDKGLTWEPNEIKINTNLTGPTVPYEPQISCDDIDNVYVVWHDNRDGDGSYGIHFNSSSDNGKTWKVDDIRLDTDIAGLGKSFYPQIACDDIGNVFVVWNVVWNSDLNGEFNDVYFSSIVIPEELPDLTHIQTQTVKEGSLLEFIVTVEDLKNRPLTLRYDLRDLDPGLSTNIYTDATFFTDFEGMTGETIGIFTWTPDFNSSGLHDPVVFYAKNESTGRCAYQAMAIAVVESYKITATADISGTINPSGEIIIPEGTNQLFTISAGVGYHIKDVLVNNISVGVVDTYEITNIDRDYAIHAFFEIDNQPPTAQYDSRSTNEDTAVEIDVLANDTDPENDTLTIISVTSPLHGISEIINNKILYTPNAEYYGQDLFDYTINDGKGQQATASVGITVIPVNDPPQAFNDTAETLEETQVEIDVVANDKDIDGDPLILERVRTPSHGITYISNNKVIYTPEKNFYGDNTFSYDISDGNRATASALITVRVLPVNDPPKAFNDSKRTQEGFPVDINVVANDTDPDGDTLTVINVSNPLRGTALIKNAATVTYTPATGFYGDDLFSYTITDGNGETSIATVNIEVYHINVPPEAFDDNTNTPEDIPVEIDVVANDTDLENEALSIRRVTLPSRGSVAISNNKVIYSPAHNYNGEDHFGYTVADKSGGEDTATVYITVTSEGDPPTPADDSAVTGKDNTIEIDVIINDTDPDNDPLTIIDVADPPHGSAFIQNNKIVYTPDSQYVGEDAFLYTVGDGTDRASTATVHITVVPVSNIYITAANGTVTPDPPPDRGTGYDLGSTANLTATPDEGYSFVRWGGDISGNQNPVTINMVTDKTIIAYFSKDDYEYRVDLSNANATDDPGEPQAGSEEKPFKTISQALNYLGPGNSLKIYEGIYNEHVHIDNITNGTNIKRIKIQSFGKVIIDGENTGGDESMLVEGSYITLTGLKFANGAKDGLKLTGNNLIVQKCESYNHSGTGTAGFNADGASDITFTRSIAYKNIGSAAGFHIINSDNVAIETCISHGNDGSGFIFENSGNLLIERSVSFNDLSADGFVFKGTTGCIIRNNISFGNRNSGFLMTEGSDSGTFYKNIAFNNSGYGFNVSGSAEDAILLNNIADNNTAGDVLVENPMRIDNNYWGDGKFVADFDINSLSDSDTTLGVPGFISPEKVKTVMDVNRFNFGKCPAFRLDLSSICINTGSALAVIMQPPDGKTIILSEDPARYFRLGDMIQIGEGFISSVADIGSAAKTITVNANVPQEAGALVNLAVVSGLPDMGTYEYSSFSWQFDQESYGDYPYYAPIYGTAEIDGDHLAVGDWIAIFDEAGNCYGVGEYQFNPQNSKYFYKLSAYAESPDGKVKGFKTGDKLIFKFYIAGTGDAVDAIPIPLKDLRFPDVRGSDINPIEINLVAAAIQVIDLKKGWNFVSFNVQPKDKSITLAFTSIIEKLDYVSTHKHWWDYTVGGSLTEIDAFRSYQIKVNEDCTLVIKGLRLLRPYTFKLEQGWTSITYLYDTPAMAFGETPGVGYTGVLKDIADNIVWIKGSGGEWTKPGLNDMTLESGKGILIKLKSDSKLTFQEEER